MTRIAAMVPIALCSSLALAGCTAYNAREPMVANANTGAQCDAANAQAHIGHAATAEMGAELLAETGARQLRWAPPRSAMTMDYRPDRLTVRYDDDMTITAIGCG